MVICNGQCGEWFHTKCALTSDSKKKKWFCKNCAVYLQICTSTCVPEEMYYFFLVMYYTFFSIYKSHDVHNDNVVPVINYYKGYVYRFSLCKGLD